MRKSEFVSIGPGDVEVVSAPLEPTAYVFRGFAVDGEPIEQTVTVGSEVSFLPAHDPSRKRSLTLTAAAGEVTARRVR